MIQFLISSKSAKCSGWRVNIEVANSESSMESVKLVVAGTIEWTTENVDES
jgi:hypothetical protein